MQRRKPFKAKKTFTVSQQMIMNFSNKMFCKRILGKNNFRPVSKHTIKFSGQKNKFYG